MDVIAYVVDMKAVLGLIAGIFLLIFIGSLILGGSPGEEQRDTDYGEQWEEDNAGETGEGGEELDVMVATRALLATDPYDGRHLYVELDDGQVVHLFGRWLDDYYVGEPKAVFPCERFRPYADSPDPFDFEHPFRVECLGPPLTPLVAEEPLSIDARRAGLVPADWERIPMSFDRLLDWVGPTARGERADANTAVPPSEEVKRAERTAVDSSQISDLLMPADPFVAAPATADAPIFSTSRGSDLLADLDPSGEIAETPDDDAPPDANASPGEQEAGDVASASEDG